MCVCVCLCAAAAAVATTKTRICAHVFGSVCSSSDVKPRGL